MTEQNHDNFAASDEDHIGPDASLLIVADDGPFLRRLARAMETRGFQVETAESDFREARPFRPAVASAPKTRRRHPHALRGSRQRRA
ncbi:hypothetical protein ACC677_36755, partial [Rhizobium ruizarguesonis]